MCTDPADVVEKCPIWEQLESISKDLRGGRIDAQPWNAQVKRCIASEPNFTEQLREKLDRCPGSVFQIGLCLSMEHILPHADRLLVIYLESQNWTGQSRELLLKVPTVLLVERMRQFIPFLRVEGTYWEFARFLELANIVDDKLRREVAELARNSDDSDIQQVGADWSEPCNPNTYRFTGYL